MREVVIVSAVRTPVGKFLGALSDISAVDLGALVVREAVRRAGFRPLAYGSSLHDECIMGCVLPAGLGQNPARQAALRGGLADTVSALTINMVCGSGLKSVALAAQAIMTGTAEIAVAGGMESMSNAPYLAPQTRKGTRFGDAKLIDSVIKDGLWCAHSDIHMGITGEYVAEKYLHHPRNAGSLRRREPPPRGCRLEPRPLRRGNSSQSQRQRVSPAELRRDESVRDNTSIEALAKLTPAFKPEGTVTAGNAPGMNDGAAALVLMSAERALALGLKPMATIRAQATSGIAPQWVMLAPIAGVQKVLERAKWSIGEVDLFELNEAFFRPGSRCNARTRRPLDKVNVNGGAVAIGHPIGASGARVLVTLIHEMQRRDAKKGVAALCLGGGNSVALAVERT